MKPLLVALFLGILSACATQPEPPKQYVYFIEPADGAVVTSPFKVKFGVVGMEVKPAGDMAAGSGHHHLLIGHDGMKKGDTIPFDATHMHFGKAQTEAEVRLPPGKYRITMQFANGAHQSYGPALSRSISVTVR